MKKTIFFFLILTVTILLSCSNKQKAEHYSFSGFGNLKIGTEITNLKNAENLQSTTDETLPDEQCFRLTSYKISEKVGTVNNIFIRTYKNKIYHISFDSSPQTNKLELSVLIFTDSIRPIGEFKNYEFISKDDKVSLTLNLDKNVNSYIYTDLMIWRILDEKRKNLSFQRIKKN